MIKNERLLSILAVAVQYIGLFGQFKVLSSKLEVSIFSEYMLLIAASTLLLGLPFTAVHQTISRFVPGTEHQRARNVLTLSVGATLPFFLIILAITIIVGQFDAAAQLIDDYNFSLAFVLTFAEGIKLYAFAYINSTRRKRFFLALTIIEHIIKVSLIAIIVIYEYGTVGLIVSSIVVANVSVILFSGVLLQIDWKYLSVKSSFQSPLFIEIVALFAPLAAWSIFGWLRDMSGRYVIDVVLSRNEVAAFAVLCTLTSLIPGIVNALVGNYYTPIMYRRHNSKEVSIERSVDLLILKTFAFTVVLVGTAFLAADKLVVLASGKSYQSIAVYLPFTIFAYSIYMISTIATTELYVNSKVKLLFIPNVLAGFVGALSIYYFSCSLGFFGAVVGYVVTYLTYALAVFFLIFCYRRNTVRNVNLIS